MTVETAVAPEPAALAEEIVAVAAFVFVAFAADVSSLNVLVNIVEMAVAVLAMAATMHFVAMAAEMVAVAEAALRAAFGLGSMSGRYSSAPRAPPAQLGVLHGALRASPPRCLRERLPPQVWPESLVRANGLRQAAAPSVAV